MRNSVWIYCPKQRRISKIKNTGNPPLQIAGDHTQTITETKPLANE
jgi:hypothetical protein